MKKNVQIYTAKEMFKIFKFEKKIPSVNMKYSNIRLNELGDLEIDVEIFGTTTASSVSEQWCISAENCCYYLNMPNYEVITVDKDGIDEYALMLYEN